MTTAFRIAATSFFSTHYETAADMLANRERVPTPPAYKLLVGRARRFTSLATQMHVEVLGALPIDPAAQPTAVFATVHGEIQTAELLISDFRDNAIVSSARFALSVHNSPSGVYSVATANTAPTTTVTGDNAIAGGWLEAALTVAEAGKPVLLSIADEPVPEVFHGPGETVGFAAGFLLAPASSSTGRAAELVISPGDTDIDPRHVLATLADPGSAPTTIVLGRIGPGAVLQLRFAP
jgi:hypothetical protein